MALAPWRRRLVGGLVVGRGQRFGFGAEELIEETRLVGPEAFGLGTVQTPQELIESLPHAIAFAVLVVLGREQLADHPLEGLGVVRECRVQRHDEGIHAL